jgi:hypothetical protein
LTLEWVGTIPGKRESRRFEGDYMLNQQDVVGQRQHEDDVAYGGWALDLHPADGIYSEMIPCTHYHAKGPYPVPYRTMYSRNIANLFLAGRVLSCSHVSFGSLRNMASLGYCAQAAGAAAALCVQKKLRPADLSQGENLKTLQRTLLRAGHHIRGMHHADPNDLALRAKISASSEYVIREFPADGPWIALEQGGAQMLPLTTGPVPKATFYVRARKATKLQTRFMTSADINNFTPEQVLSELSYELQAGQEKEITISCPTPLTEAQYGYYAFLANADVEIRCTEQRVTGILTLFNHNRQEGGDQAGNTAKTSEIGVDAFDLWSPRRRPEGHNFALRLSEPIAPFSAAQIGNGIYRPTSTANAWVALPTDPNPAISLEWQAPQTISRVVIDFDPDWDHTMESVMRWHPDRAMPFTVRDFQLETEEGKVLLEISGNYLARGEARLKKPVSVRRLTLRIRGVNGPCPAAVFGIGVYA